MAPRRDRSQPLPVGTRLFCWHIGIIVVNQVPVLQALLVADRIYPLANGSLIIAGTTSRLFMELPPQAQELEGDNGITQRLQEVKHPANLSVYISLTDVSDQTLISIQFVYLAKNRPLMHTEVFIEKGDRLGTTEIVAPLPTLDSDVMQGPGTYALEVVCNDEILGSHRIQVIDKTQEETQ